MLGWCGFGQVGAPQLSKNSGTGLGLAISKALMERHGGSLTLDSEIGEGTTVELRFPAERTIRS